MGLHCFSNKHATRPAKAPLQNGARSAFQGQERSVETRPCSDSCTGCSCWPRVGRVRSETEAKQHFKRRRKRKREKISKATIEPAENGERAAEAVEEERISATDELAPFQVHPLC